MKKLKNFCQPPTMRELANEQIEQLINYAIKVSKTEPEYAVKYIKMARKIAMRHKIPLGSKRKQLFCKKCNLPYDLKKLIIKIHKNFARICCPQCGFVYKIHLSKLDQRYKTKLKVEKSQ